MAGKSIIHQLEQQYRQQIDEWIADGTATITEMHAYLTELGADTIGLESVPARSTVGKYVADYNKTAAALRESREMTAVIMQDLGPQMAEGEQGRVLVNMVRTLLMRSLKPLIDNPDGALDSKELVAVSRSLKDMTQTMRMEQDYDKNIREQAAKEAREQAAESAATSARSHGLTEATIASIKSSILGIKEAP